jgi:hypothetical protein
LTDTAVLVPATALALPLFLLLAGVGLSNRFWSVFLPSIVSPFGVRILLSIAVSVLAPALITVFPFQFVAACIRWSRWWRWPGAPRAGWQLDSGGDGWQIVPRVDEMGGRW